MKHFILLFILFMLSGFSFSQMITRDMLGPNQETALKALYRSLNIAENTSQTCKFHWDTIQGTYYNTSTTFQNKIALDGNGMIKGLNLDNCHINGNIPDEIGLLTELNYLHIAENCIYSLSDKICETKLESLNFGSQDKCYEHNSLPACFSDLYFITFLLIYENINSLPSFLSGNDIDRIIVGATTLSSIPENFSTLSSNGNYSFESNEIAEIPIFSNIELGIRNNRLQFNDIEKNMSNFPSANYYSPQKEVRVSSPQYFCGAEMRLFVEVGGSANRYRWLKDGVEVQAFSEEAAYVKTNPTQEDAGTYVVEITNELVPGLTLQSEPIEVIIGNPPPPLIRHNE